ncbi:Mediator of RNA polymerase II transcription subunit 15a [Acorus calamus]|uniref:Mediator of RNA polymerase II transcription subunit 15a n=1 Tax=Acorus calamus TaxID=4465 RepID=A0AAV9E1G9_ACOCL|nr:Mediator of RNA polymerase II transcription subunit 15a [Acorus calamus]
MEGNDWRTAQSGDQSMDPSATSGGAVVDWRSQLQQESRHRIVNKIMETLKRHLPISGPEGMIELKKIAVRFEEKIYTAATSQTDYLRKISLKMLTMETKTQNPGGANPLPSNASSGSQNPPDPGLTSLQLLLTQTKSKQQARNQAQSIPIPLANQSQARQQILPQTLQNPIASANVQGSTSMPPVLPSMTGLTQPTVSNIGQTSGLQNISGISQNTVNNPLGQGTMSNMLNTQRPISGRHAQQVIAQQQQQSQNSHLASMDSTAQTGNVGGIDWQEEAYQMIKSLKEMYLPELNEFYQKLATKLQQNEAYMQPGKHMEQYDKLKNYKTAVERIISVLQLSKNQLQPGIKEKLVICEKQIVSLLASNRRKPTNLLQQGQQFQQPGGQSHSMSQQLQSQVSQLQQHDNHVNQSVNLQGSVTSMQSAVVSGMQHGSMPLSTSHLGVPTTQQSMMNAIHSGSNLDSVQGNALSSMQPGSIGSAQQGGVGPISQNNIHASQQSNINTLSHSNLNSLQSNAPSPQISQHSSPQIDQQGMLSTLPKAGTPLQSSNSPFIVPSPSTPAPSPVPGEPEKQLSSITSLSNARSVGHQQAAHILPQAQSLAVGTPGISASPLLAEFTNVDGNQGNASTMLGGRSNAKEQPIDRLLKAIQSLSPQALSSSISDIGSVVSMVDRIAGSAPGNGSRAAVGEDLVAMTKCRLQARNFIPQDGTSATKKIKRHTSAMPLNAVSSAGSVNDNFRQANSLEISELESTATSKINKQRAESNHALLEEIREINKRLINTVVDISDGDAHSVTKGEGTVVKCSYTAVALSPRLKSQYMSSQISPILPLRLLVPANYPNCSPILLDQLPVEMSKEPEDLPSKTKSRFSISLRGLTQPMSVGEMVRTWDKCVRMVITEYAQQNGGGSFSSRYGTWENIMTPV